MLGTIDILSLIEEQKAQDIKQLAKKLEMPLEQLKDILTNLNRHNLIVYNVKTGKIMLPTWLVNLEKKIESIKPPTGTIILPRNEEVQIQDVAIGNFTKTDLELRIRLKAKLKEIAICDLG